MSLSIFLQPRPACLVYITWIVYKIGGRGPSSTFFNVGSKQHIAFFCCSHLAFSPNVSLKFRQCVHTVVLTWLQLGSQSISFLYERLDFRRVNRSSCLSYVYIVIVIPHKWLYSFSFFFSFLCLMSYQPLGVIKCQNLSYKITAMMQLNP